MLTCYYFLQNGYVSHNSIFGHRIIFSQRKKQATTHAMLWVFIVVVNSKLSDFGKDLLQNSSDMLLPEVTGTGLLGTVPHLFATDRYKLQALAILVHASGTSQSLGLLADCPSHPQKDLDQAKYEAIN